jgi:hypothetical protein
MTDKSSSRSDRAKETNQKNGMGIMQYGNQPVASRAGPASRETLEYIQSMLEQLSRMAEFERATTLTYYMHMAYLECSDILRAAAPVLESAEQAQEIRGAIARRA